MNTAPDSSHLVAAGSCSVVFVGCRGGVPREDVLCGRGLLYRQGNLQLHTEQPQRQGNWHTR